MRQSVPVLGEGVRRGPTSAERGPGGVWADRPRAAGTPWERGLLPLPRGAQEMSLHLVAGCSHPAMRARGPSSDAEEVICVARADFLGMMGWTKGQGAGVVAWVSVYGSSHIIGKQIFNKRVIETQISVLIEPDPSGFLSSLPSFLYPFPPI